MARKILAIAILLVASLLQIACTPEQIEYYLTEASPEVREAVDRHLQERARTPLDCNQALDKHWPADSRAWARKVVWRESRNDPSAQNRRSTAAGCMQLLRVHSPRFARLGYSWERDRYDPEANILVGLSLYREAGARPWNF